VVRLVQSISHDSQTMRDVQFLLRVPLRLFGWSTAPGCSGWIQWYGHHLGRTRLDMGAPTWRFLQWPAHGLALALWLLPVGSNHSARAMWLLSVRGNNLNFGSALGLAR
jgi:hypothetical protein